VKELQHETFFWMKFPLSENGSTFFFLDGIM